MLKTARKMHFRAIAGGVCSLMGIIAFCAMNGSSFFAYSSVWIIIEGCAIWASTRWMAEKQCMIAKRLSWLLACVFLFLQAYGYQLYLHDGSNVRALLLCMIVSVCLAPAAAFPVMVFLKADANHTVSENKTQVFSWVKNFLFLFFAWFVVFLAYYPGLFAYDVHYQLNQYLNHKVTAWHPPIHTFYLGFFYTLGKKLGSYNIGFALHIISQMIVLAAVYSYIIYDLRRSGCKKVWCTTLLVLFGLFPVHSLLSISCTKDILFSGFFVLSTYQLYQFWKDPSLLHKPSFCLRFLISVILSCLLRNNVCYGLMAFIPLAVLLASANRKRISFLILTGFALSFFAYQSMQYFFPDYSITTRETLSIPVQQLSRVAVKITEAQITDETDEVVTEIKEFIPDPGKYNEVKADAVKSQLKLVDSNRTADFLRLWFRVGLKYPLTYIDSFFLNTQGMWRMDDTTHAAIYGYGLEKRQGYLLTDTKPGYQIEHHSFIPALEKLYENLFSANEYQKIPILSLLFAPALYVWLTVLLAARAIVQKQRALLAACCFALCYVCTLLLGPCVLVRYYYILFVLVPVLLILTFETNPSKASQGKYDKKLITSSTP